MENIILHIDVNNAFLSWTAVYLLKNGSKYDIRNSYSVIGGSQEARRGIVLAKSMSAKKLGIITGETLYSARKKCKILKIYEPNYSWYQEMSRKMFEIISKYTNDFEIFSIDECFIDYTKIKKLYGNEVEFAYKLKDEIYNTLGFTVNIGIGNNKLCAKMASDFEKPNKVHTLYKNEVESKMFPLDVGELFGIGKSTEKKLKDLGIKTIFDLATSSKEELYKYFKNSAIKMIDSANGIDYSKVISEKKENQCISNSTTIDHDVDNIEELYSILEQLSDNVGIILRNQNKYTNVIAVGLKDCFFKSKTHQKKLVNATNSTDKIYKISKELLNEMWDNTPIRLVSIRLDNLSLKNNYQVSLFDNIKKQENDVNLEKTIDSLKEKYGTKIINKASLKDKKVHQKYMK